VEQELLVRGSVPRPKRGEVDRIENVESASVDAIRDHVDLVERHTESRLDLAGHKATATDDAPRLVREPELGVVDLALHLTPEVAVVTAVLRRVDCGQQGNSVRVLERYPGECNQPVVDVDQIDATQLVDDVGAAVLQVGVPGNGIVIKVVRLGP